MLELMLHMALDKANAAVACETSDNVAGAIKAYSESVVLLSQVLSAMHKVSERKQLQDIHDAYRDRLWLLRALDIRTPIHNLNEARPSEPPSQPTDQSVISAAAPRVSTSISTTHDSVIQRRSFLVRGEESLLVFLKRLEQLKPKKKEDDTLPKKSSSLSVQMLDSRNRRSSEIALSTLQHESLATVSRAGSLQRKWSLRESSDTPRRGGSFKRMSWSGFDVEKRRIQSMSIFGKLSVATNSNSKNQQAWSSRRRSIVLRENDCTNHLQMIFAFERSMTRGEYVTERLYIPKNMWYQTNVRLLWIDVKLAACKSLLLGLSRLEHWKRLEDTMTSMVVLNTFEETLEDVQATLAKKLSNKLSKSMERMNDAFITSAKSDDHYRLYLETLQKLFQQTHILEHWQQYYNTSQTYTTLAQKVNKLSELLNLVVIGGFVAHDAAALLGKWLKQTSTSWVDAV
ncbi:hypothetical protein DFQ28_010056 [Apophysomyces sp. BC1034]|nr:hypothetical protein DFQ30_009863 [Apophysomyces sp. BC1015]KAG0172148.1 hypothetical protein DFQ29_008493 [Apophysomyces sp. BC1021]KAG0185050.1 hypothetical protein DFQ28_010056 [Apophysomyces sp. BC1034]